jgi:tetratricopeptide (TPR) repeat protein
MLRDMHVLFRAEEMFRKAISLEPHGRSYEQLGKVLVMQDRPTEALHEYQEALKLMPGNADTLCQFGLLCLRQGGLLYIDSFICSKANICTSLILENSCKLISVEIMMQGLAMVCWLRVLACTPKLVACACMQAMLLGFVPLKPELCRLSLLNEHSQRNYPFMVDCCLFSGRSVCSGVQLAVQVTRRKHWKL